MSFKGFSCFKCSLLICCEWVRSLRLNLLRFKVFKDITVCRFLLSLCVNRWLLLCEWITSYGHFLCLLSLRLEDARLIWFSFISKSDGDGIYGRLNLSLTDVSCWWLLCNAFSLNYFWSTRLFLLGEEFFVFLFCQISVDFLRDFGLLKLFTHFFHEFKWLAKVELVHVGK